MSERVAKVRRLAGNRSTARQALLRHIAEAIRPISARSFGTDHDGMAQAVLDAFDPAEAGLLAEVERLRAVITSAAATLEGYEGNGALARRVGERLAGALGSDSGSSETQA